MGGSDCAIRDPLRNILVFSSLDLFCRRFVNIVGNAHAVISLEGYITFDCIRLAKEIRIHEIGGAKFAIQRCVTVYNILYTV